MKKVFIIAEAGVNHNGIIEIAKKLIDIAIESGADAVKFQTFKTEKLVSKNAKKAKYQIEDTNKSVESQFEMLKKLELSETAHYELMKYCKSKNIVFLSSPFDHDSIDLLVKLGLEIFKIPSGEITNLPYLRYIGKLNKKIIISTGMSLLSEIEDALDVLIEAGTKKENIVLLHTTSQYPASVNEVNLNVMCAIQKKFKVNVGYSDHTIGIEIPIAAVAIGAKVIEKHFTLDKNMEGPDHKASLEPNELKAMVKAIRNIEFAMGNEIKKPSKSEILNMRVVRKSIVARCDIQKGEILSEHNITTKRPGNGISPMRWDEVIGTVATNNYNEDDLI